MIKFKLILYFYWQILILIDTTKRSSLEGSAVPNETNEQNARPFVNHNVSLQFCRDLAKGSKCVKANFWEIAKNINRSSSISMKLTFE